jgi:phosphoglycerate dehydrogenase-like enzyme
MKKILVYTPRLSDSNRRDIRDAAEAYGVGVVFCDDADAALREANDAQIILSADPALPKAAPALEWMCCAFAGVEPMLLPGAFANPRALLTNASGAYGVTIAEHIVMVTLELMRRQMEYNRIVAAREWVRDLPIRSIRGSRVTLLGAGDIGREAARRLRAFEPKSIVALNRSGRDAGSLFDRTLPVSALDDILPQTDFLVMSLPGTRETRHIMDGRRLALLPKDAYLVNVGRGSAVDEAALLALMQGGHLAGAALDVFEQEPLPSDSPLWDCPRLLITTHVAGNMTLEYTVDRIVAMFIEDLQRYCAGKPLTHLVDREKGY